MITYKKLVQKSYYKDMGEEVMWKMTDDTNKFVESMRVLHPAEVDKFLTDMENDICYPPLTEAQAKAYVSGMDNKDGTKGEHWTHEQTQTYMNSHEEYKNLNDLDFYVAMNMMYSDYYKPSYTTENYASMAKDFLTDKDAPGNKVVRYIHAME